MTTPQINHKATCRNPSSNRTRGSRNDLMLRCGDCGRFVLIHDDGSSAETWRTPTRDNTPR